jgi:hypothetical protein
MPLWFALSTVVVMVSTGVVVQFSFRRWVSHQEAEYEGFEDRSEQGQRDFLLELSKRKLRILRWTLAGITVVTVIGVWYVGGSMFLIAQNNDETNDVVNSTADLVRRQDAADERERLVLCRARNTSVREARQVAGERDEMVVRGFSEAIVLAADAAGAVEAGSQLEVILGDAAERTIAGLPEIDTPELDADCDGDGAPAPDPDDYLP